ncbi:hypothetical protein CBL_01649 [Carabus blaptoides fortunei]
MDKPRTQDLASFFFLSRSAEVSVRPQEWQGASVVRDNTAPLPGATGYPDLSGTSAAFVHYTTTASTLASLGVCLVPLAYELKGPVAWVFRAANSFREEIKISQNFAGEEPGTFHGRSNRW